MHAIASICQARLRCSGPLNHDTLEALGTHADLLRRMHGSGGSSASGTGSGLGNGEVVGSAIGRREGPAGGLRHGGGAKAAAAIISGSGEDEDDGEDQDRGGAAPPTASGASSSPLAEAEALEKQVLDAGKVMIRGARIERFRSLR